MPKQGEYRTERLASVPTEQTSRNANASAMLISDSLKMFQVAPKSIKPSNFLSQKKKHEDILFEFSNAARNFVPLVEKH